MLSIGSEIKGGENGLIGSADVANTLIDLLHGVLVGVGFLVESPAILNDVQASPLF